MVKFAVLYFLLERSVSYKKLAVQGVQGFTASQQGFFMYNKKLKLTAAQLRSGLYCLTLASLSTSFGLFSAPSFAQEVAAEPLYGTANLEAGFMPDPHTVEVTPGGPDSAEHLGDDCWGYITNNQPDYDLNYEAGSAELGIIVDSDIDTTLVINDPRGNWHCSDDSDRLFDANPGILFNTPLSGNYNIWIGTYSEDEESDSTFLAITEYGEDEWADLNIRHGGIDNLDNIESIAVVDSIDFGDNSSNWANDGECDDPRFEGDGMASGAYDEDIRRDASDCLELYEDGSIRLAGQLIDGIDFGDNASRWAYDDECDDGRFEGDGMAASLFEGDMFHDSTDCLNLYRSGLIQLSADADTQSENVIRGTLESGDERSDDGVFTDRYTFNGFAGGTAVIDLRSGRFDTYLRVRSPSGIEMTNDDYNDSLQRSLITVTPMESGVYQVFATAFDRTESGAYTLQIDTQSALPERDLLTHSGDLATSDRSMKDGGFYDSYYFEGAPGNEVQIDLRSPDFDTYLIVMGPNGARDENDDADGTDHSQVVMALAEMGLYEVIVTSYSSGESGNYDLDIDINRGEASGSTEIVDLDIGETIDGRLQLGDRLSEDGMYQDFYTFTGTAGESIVIDMTSNAIDTYLWLVTPAGDIHENDDHNDSVDQSQIALNLIDSGQYTIWASSYSSGETGTYQLSIREQSSGMNNVSPLATNGGQIYGIFAGIADYPGTDDDLSLTDQDALRARDALIQGAGMNPANAVTLIDSDATKQNFRDAINVIASTIDEQDTLVLFYSGHGDRIERPNGPDSVDPDGIDETMEFYDGALIDDELAKLLENVNAGTVLLVMDSCYSGGFSKDIVSQPGRMGLFSSEEDVTSQVASKFIAGGYLSVFFEEALTGEFADRDANGELTAIEISQYLHERFQDDVKELGETDYTRNSGPEAAYQRLVVDRGGVSADNVLFTRHL